MAEAVYGIRRVDDRDVQPRVLDRVALDGVVLLGPALAGVVGRVVGCAGQDRPGVVVDQDALET
jgi:hypothetical protein